MNTVNQHDIEIHANLKRWERKPLLHKVYRKFHLLIRDNLACDPDDLVVELGSGIGNIKEVIPGCIRTDLFPNPWIDQTENAYALSFDDAAVGGIILFDVFHHLRYPGTAFKELYRVLKPGGRLIIFDPCLSLLGRFVYGVCHSEPIAIGDAIEWSAPSDWNAHDVDYYAAQGNATRIFVGHESIGVMSDWRIATVKRLSAISYVASGGYSSPQLYPTAMLPYVRILDKICDFFPSLFATRLLVVLEKNNCIGTTCL